MTERKPTNESVTDFVERQIREGQERGVFDDLPLAGKPIPGIDDGARQDPEMWWVDRKVAEEHAFELPPALVARQHRDNARVRIAAATSEHDVRAIIAAANEIILAINRTAIAGPPTDTMPFDVERTVQRWRDDPDTVEVPPEAPVAVVQPAPRRGPIGRIRARMLGLE